MAPVKLDIYGLFSKLPQRQNLPDLFSVLYGLFQKIHQDYLRLGGTEEHLAVGEVAWLGIVSLVAVPGERKQLWEQHRPSPAWTLSQFQQLRKGA